MPIISSDIKFYLSGGAGNSDPNASLGGEISNTEITSGLLHALFDIISSAEASGGDSEYRCVYAKNTNGTLTAQNSKLWVETESPSTDTDELIGLGTSAINGVEQTIADEQTAPVGVTFSQANGEGAAEVIGDLAPSAHKAFWVNRAVLAAAAAYSNDGPTIRFGCDTAA